jgi:hypothetical protein
MVADPPRRSPVLFLLAGRGSGPYNPGMARLLACLLLALAILFTVLHLDADPRAGSP